MYVEAERHIPKLVNINGKTYDFNPRNKTFLQTAQELHHLGIKNYYFMLEVKNPRSVFIDPFNPRITDQEIATLFTEYRNNIWAYARDAVRIRTPSGIVPFGLHRGLAAAIWNFNRSQDFCLTEPRQTWKTTGIIASVISWAFQLQANQKMHFFGKSNENTKDNQATLRDDINLLPDWLKLNKYTNADGKLRKARESSEVLKNDLTHNQLYIHSKANSISSAQTMARGSSGSIFYYDEIEHTPYFSEILANSAPAFKTSSDTAKAAGLKSCRIFSSTPGNLDTREGIDSYPIIQSMIPWTEKIYDMNEDEISKYKDAFRAEYHDTSEEQLREVIDVFYIEYQYYQVRKDYAWVQEQMALSGDKLAIRREVLLQRLRGSDKSPFAQEDIEALIANTRKSTDDLLINGQWLFKIYDHGINKSKYLNNKFAEIDDSKFDKDIPYLVGVDPSGGTGNDNFAVCIVNPYNLQIAAEFKSPYVTLTSGTQMLVELVNKYIPKAIVIIERNNVGNYLIQNIVDNTNIKENLYWSENAANKQLDDIAQYNPKDYELASQSLAYKKYGNYVTAKVREAMMQSLVNMVKDCRQVVNTQYLVEDICKLERNPRTGKIAAIQGEHDDSLFAYLHCIYTWNVGDNLETFGFSKPEVHPILGRVQEDLDEYEDDSSWFSTENVRIDSDKYAMEYAIMLEERCREIQEALPNIVEDPVYNRVNKLDNVYDGTTSISPFFFDEINNVGLGA